MSEPKIAKKAPYHFDVVAGESYWWCACGLSATQPFCDGSHKTTSFTPVEYKADESKHVLFCGCKYTATQPLCDMRHKTL